jgi:hypothetical protein
MRPGTTATRLANANAPAPTTTIQSTGTVGSGTAEIPLANRAQSHRPSPMPSGMPKTAPTPADTEDCHATAPGNLALCVTECLQQRELPLAAADRGDKGQPQGAQRSGRQGASEQQRGRPDGAVVGDLGRAER